jgi:hypothetical protein
VPKQRRHIRGVGDPVALAGEECRELAAEIPVEFRFAHGDSDPAKAFYAVT